MAAPSTAPADRMAPPPAIASATAAVPTVDAGSAPESVINSAPTDDAGRVPPSTKEGARPDRHWLGDKAQQPGAGIRWRRERRLLAAAALLALLLAGQLAFQFRGTISLAMPSLQPALAALSGIIGSEIPLPRRADLLTIEASDLQSEPGRSSLLTLQVTLRNQARYAQAYPAIELTLTDTKDKVIARRVLLPEEYLPPATLETQSFAAASDIDVLLRLETQSIEAAGYRLYLFHP